MSERDPSPGRILRPLFFVLFIGFIAYRLGYLPTGKSALVGKPAPDFALDLIANAGEGDRLHLADLRGQTVILDFWATWCGPCQTEAPILDRFSRKAREAKVTVVGINTSDQPGAGGQFARARKLTYPMVYDPEDRVANLYGVTSLPTLVVINPKGDIVSLDVGVVNERSLEGLVDLAQK